MFKKTFLIAVIFLPLFLQAQEDDKAKFGIKLSGFVKNDFFWDSRQTVAAREGHFLLFPAAESLDLNDEDVNAKASFNFLAVQSRLQGSISGPDAFGAKTSGVIEADFFAQANDNINLLRLRHAFVKLSWPMADVLLGQYWNPLFVTDCYPATVSFNTGAPIQPFARNPQIRVTFKAGKLRLIAAALSQRDYVSRGPNGASSEYLRNAAIPDMHLQFHINASDKETKNGVIAGFGGAYKKIVPELETALGYKTKRAVSGMSGIAFAQYKTQSITIKAEGIYGQNLPDVLSLSGYAVTKIIDVSTGELEYVSMENIAGWLDVHTNGEKMQVGMFAGYTRNLGAGENIIPGTIVGFGTDIRSLYRVSPRVILNSGKFRLAGELEYTAADYIDSGKPNSIDEKGEIQETYQVGNIRLLIGAYYFF